MGWTFTNTDLKRKEAINELYNWDSDRYRTRVLKSVMKGSVYYGAVEQICKDTAIRTVTGVVVLTSSDKKHGYNFGYKSIDETMGPGYYDCPRSILNLLTDTDNEYALEWRKNCRENLSRPKLSDLPIGTRIKVKLNGEEMVLTKYPPCCQFRTPVWVNLKNHTYISKKWITEFELL